MTSATGRWRGSRAAVTELDFGAAHVIELSVGPADIDAYDHVNNAVYLTWLDRAAWSHSAALGVPLAQCLSCGAAWPRSASRSTTCARRARRPGARRHLDRERGRAAARQRRFQVLRTADGVTLARARIDYVCINLDSGRAARMPESFARAYVPTAAA